MADDRVHLHIENDRALGVVFEVTEQRMEAALERFPDVAERLTYTIGYDCETFDERIATADALLCWNSDPACTVTTVSVAAPLIV